jgi:hypothetical protein
LHSVEPARYTPAMFGSDLTQTQRYLIGIAAALTFAVFYIAGLQLGGHW